MTVLPPCLPGAGTELYRPVARGYHPEQQLLHFTPHRLLPFQRRRTSRETRSVPERREVNGLTSPDVTRVIGQASPRTTWDQGL